MLKMLTRNTQCNMLEIMVLAMFAEGLATFSKGSEEIVDKNSVQYEYRFVAVNAIKAENFSNEPDDHLKNKNKLIAKTQQVYNPSENQKDISLALQNLYTSLQGFQNDHCLLVIDNWQNVKIKQTAVMPSMLRSFELAFSHRKLHAKGQYHEYLDQVLIPKPNSLKNNTFSENSLRKGRYHDCPISSFYYPLTTDEVNDAFCVDLSHEMFLLKSRPWQCEIQVNLLMPNYLLKNRNFPGIFTYNYNDDYYFKFMPSTRPKIHLFLDFKLDHDTDTIELLDWITNTKSFYTNVFQSTFKIYYSSQNRIYFTSDITCNMKKQIRLFNLACNVSAVNYINYCIDCPTLLLSLKMNFNSLSFESFAQIDRTQVKSLWFGYLNCPGVIVDQVDLCSEILNFFAYDSTAIRMPLKNLYEMRYKYSDERKLLAFAFASVFKHLLGNYTFAPTKYIKYDDFFRSKLALLTRKGNLEESFFDNQNVALRFKNKFGSLRFVSCGSRGLESFQLYQFVSVFEANVWAWLLVFGVFLTVVMNVLKGSTCLVNLSYKGICLIKVVLEQGDPFPGKFIKSMPFRFLIGGTLLGGLVLSNAFKSTNVYSIVLPKQALKFNTIDELVIHGYNVYTKLTFIEYCLHEFAEMPHYTNAVIKESELKKYLRIYSKNKKLMFFSTSELSEYQLLFSIYYGKVSIQDKNSVTFLSNNTKPHLGLYDILVKPLDILTPLVQIGMLTMKQVQKSVQTLQGVDFWKKQEIFIKNDLKKCNKTAWILPDYQAQKLSRMLYKAEKHSDVGVIEYFRPNLNFYFSGAVSSPLIKRASSISGSGLLEWWSNLINRTDLVRRRDNKPPVKPTMSGNIQMIFILLAVGMSVAQILLIVELHECILRLLKCVFSMIKCVLLNVIQHLKTKMSTVKSLW